MRNGIHKLSDMIGTKTVRSQYGRSVPIPYPATVPQRIVASWWVLTGRAEAVIWPEDGELEDAIDV